jgi:hypothetical protein
MLLHGFFVRTIPDAVTPLGPKKKLSHLYFRQLLLHMHAKIVTEFLSN